MPIEGAAEFAVAVGNPANQPKRDNRPNGGESEAESHHWGFSTFGASVDRRMLIQSFNVLNT